MASKEQVLNSFIGHCLFFIYSKPEVMHMPTLSTPQGVNNKVKCSLNPEKLPMHLKSPQLPSFLGMSTSCFRGAALLPQRQPENLLSPGTWCWGPSEAVGKAHVCLWGICFLLLMEKDGESLCLEERK